MKTEKSINEFINPQDLDIRVINIKKFFKDIKAVDGVSLEIRKGEFIALVGPNGAGKTTLVEMIEGLQSPDSGEVYIKGKLWKGNEDTLRRILGISLQETYFFDKITVLETLNLFASFYGLGEDRIKYILELVNLDMKSKVYVNNLSGGQKQKLALGIALLNNAEILLLDEPTTGLDPSSRREIWNILKRLKEQRNISMILTTHYMEEAEFLCERIIIMDKGKILAEGQLNKLLSDYSNESNKMNLNDLFLSMTGRHLDE
ncbi:ABC transporter ATP-binding protein [Candidatus Desantisbacteria bacterium]|nr:ABC transporter ATP-binding protein [Candidatus Desantisbacteria bacterium]